MVQNWTPVWRQEEIWSLCQWQERVHCPHNRRLYEVGDSSKFLRSYKANRINSRVMRLWGNSRPCAVQTSAFSKGTDLTITKIHLFSDSSNQRASNSVQVNSSPTTGLQKVFRGWPYQLSEGDTHLSSHSWSLVSFRVSSVWKRQLIFSILQIPLTRRQFWKRLHSLFFFFHVEKS